MEISEECEEDTSLKLRCGLHGGGTSVVSSEVTIAGAGRAKFVATTSSTDFCRYRATIQHTTLFRSAYTELTISRVGP